MDQSEIRQNEHPGRRPGQYRDAALQQSWFGRRWKKFLVMPRNAYIPGSLQVRQSNRLDYGDPTPQPLPKSLCSLAVKLMV